MADFVQKTNVKRSVRTLATQIPDVAAMNSLIQNIIDTNPFQCVDYVRAGVTNAGVSRGNESYTARIVYENPTTLKAVGTVSANAKSVAGLNAAAAAVLADNALKAAIGGDPIRDTGNESYSAIVKCHDANGEDYTVSFTRKTVTISSYEDEAIVTRVDTWADSKPVLA